jgi:hypothetical protein
MVPECVPKKADRMDNQRKHNSFQFDEFWGLFVKLPQRKGKKTINNTGNSAFLPQKIGKLHLLLMSCASN